jgi:hypothetical protein
MKRRVWFVVLMSILMVTACAEEKTEFRGISGSLRVTGTMPDEKEGPGPCTISLTIQSPAGVLDRGVVLSHRIGESKKDFRGSYKSTLFTYDAAEDVYSADIPEMPKGTRVFYYVTVRDSAGNKVTLPASKVVDDKPHHMMFKGVVSSALLIAHVGFMFLGLALVLGSMISAVVHLISSRAKKALHILTLLACVAVFIGGFPLGFIMAHIRFGQAWGGIPVGWDITDNKTLIIFLFYLVAIVLRKNATFARPGRDILSERAFAGLALAAGVITFVLYLIPHSI